MRSVPDGLVGASGGTREGLAGRLGLSLGDLGRVRGELADELLGRARELLADRRLVGDGGRVRAGRATGGERLAAVRISFRTERTEREEREREEREGREREREKDEREGRGKEEVEAGGHHGTHWCESPVRPEPCVRELSWPNPVPVVPELQGKEQLVKSQLIMLREGERKGSGATHWWVVSWPRPVPAVPVVLQGRASDQVSSSWSMQRRRAKEDDALVGGVVTETGAVRGAGRAVRAGGVVAGHGVLGLLGQRPVVAVGVGAGRSVADTAGTRRVRAGVRAVAEGRVVAAAVAGPGPGGGRVGRVAVRRVAAGEGVLDLLAGRPVVAVGVGPGRSVRAVAAEARAGRRRRRRGRGVPAAREGVAELLADAAAGRRRVGAVGRAREGSAAVGAGAVGTADRLLLLVAVSGAARGEAVLLAGEAGRVLVVASTGRGGVGRVGVLREAKGGRAGGVSLPREDGW